MASIDVNDRHDHAVHAQCEGQKQWAEENHNIFELVDAVLREQADASQSRESINTSTDC